MQGKAGCGWNSGTVMVWSPNRGRFSVARHKPLVKWAFLISLLACACTSEDLGPIECTQNNTQLELVKKTDLQTCDAATGSIEVTLTGGSGQNEFSINNSAFQSSPLFTNLSAGEYVIIGRDRSQCADTLLVRIMNFNTDLSATAEVAPNTACLTGNGTIEALAAGGQEPYRYTINSGAFTTTSVFDGLENGLYPVKVVDAQNCAFEFSVTVPRGETGVSWVNEIKPIIDTRCAKPICHMAGTGRLDLTKFANVQANAVVIKSKTQDRSMPFDEPLNQDQIDLIACWVDDGAKDN